MDSIPHARPACEVFLVPHGMLLDATCISAMLDALQIVVRHHSLRQCSWRESMHVFPVAILLAAILG